MSPLGLLGRRSPLLVDFIFYLIVASLMGWLSESLLDTKDTLIVTLVTTTLSVPIILMWAFLWSDVVTLHDRGLTIRRGFRKRTFRLDQVSEIQLAHPGARELSVTTTEGILRVRVRKDLISTKGTQLLAAFQSMKPSKEGA